MNEERRSVFEALKETFCGHFNGCYPVGNETFEHLLYPEV